MLMARWGSIFTAPALEWRIDAQHWPARGDRRDGQPLGALVLVIGVVWLAVALRDVTAGGSTIAGFGVAAAWVSLAIGAALALWGCRILVRRQSIRIGDHDIQVRVRHLLGETSWHESLRHYGGVVWRSEPIRRRGVRQIVHLVELWHEDPSRTVTLLSSTAEQVAADAWQGWARRLGLAPIRWRAAEPAPTPGDAELAASRGAHSA
jgi:hypothetical protein